MKTKIISSEEIVSAVELLKNGELIAIPTETVYGLAAPISNPSVGKIFSLKGRPQDNPLIAHVSSIEMAELIGQNLPRLFYQLAEKFWPGPLTLIVEKKDSVPSIVSAGGATIAIRMPSHPLALQIIEKVGEPLVAPSANLSGRPSPTTVQHVLEDFEGKLVAVVDGGQCQYGIESTVLSLVHPTPTLMRPGSIKRSVLESSIDCKISDPEVGGPILSPGMKYRHYAPKAPIRIVQEFPSSGFLNDPFVISRKKIGHFIHRSLQANTFYSFLREADEKKVNEIWVVLDPESVADEALMNRLYRASGIT